MNVHSSLTFQIVLVIGSIALGCSETAPKSTSPASTENISPADNESIRPASTESASPAGTESVSAPGTESASPAGNHDDTAQPPDDLGKNSTRGRFRARRESQPEEDDPLASIGYAAGSQPASELSGVTRHLSGLSVPGLNFMVSGHVPGAQLFDMDGNVVHEWGAKFTDLWPERVKDAERGDAHFWRRAYLFDNGDVIGIFESLGMVKLDRDSQVLWAKPISAHHDIQVFENGELYTLGRKTMLMESAVPTIKKLSSLRPPERQSNRRTILHDYVIHFTSEEAAPTWLSIYQCFLNAEAEHSWIQPAIDFWTKEKDRSMTGSHRDIFHTNSLKVLDGSIAERVPEFAQGNILLSLRHLDMIAVLDPVEKKVVWSMTGSSSLQHDAKITSEGHLLYFDNQWQLGRSRVVLMDPLTREVVWQYGTKPGEEFYSETCGTVQELPNKNLLITETDPGRAFEVTRDGKVAWEFYNPHGVGDDSELIASLFEVVRVDSDVAAGWLQ